MTLRATIFDLNGVLVDTGKYPYLAWRWLALGIGFDFPANENEKLKGDSRMRSIDLLLEVGKMEGRFSEADKIRLADRKNTWYVNCLERMGKDEILPGETECPIRLRSSGMRIGVGSASRNAGLVLDRLGFRSLFDDIVDGNRTRRAKPDPEVFLLCARDLGVDPADCVVFEDAQAGFAAAKAGGMRAIAVGSPAGLRCCDLIVPRLHSVDAEGLIRRFE